MQLHAIPIEVETLMCTDWMHNVRRTRWLAIVDAERRERLRIQLRCTRVCNRFDRNKRFRARLGSRLDVDFESCAQCGSTDSDTLSPSASYRRASHRRRANHRRRDQSTGPHRHGDPVWVQSCHWRSSRSPPPRLLRGVFASHEGRVSRSFLALRCAC